MTGTFSTSQQGEEHVQEGSCARLAHLLRQNWQCLTPRPGAQTQAVRQSRPLALAEGFLASKPLPASPLSFGKQASPSCPRARRGAGFTATHSTLLHPAMPCSVVLGKLLLPWVLHWVPEATDPMSQLGQSELGRGGTAQLLPPAPSGWVQLLSKTASGKLRPIGNYVRHGWSLKTTDELAIPALETDAKVIGRYFG